MTLLLLSHMRGADLGLPLFMCGHHNHSCSVMLRINYGRRSLFQGTFFRRYGLTCRAYPPCVSYRMSTSVSSPAIPGRL